MSVRLRICFILLCLFLCVCRTSTAQGPAFTLLTASYGNSYVPQQSFGDVFTVVTPITVTSLGFFDYTQTGLIESHAVGIFDNSGTLLTSPSDVVPAGTVGTLDNHFRYISIAPLLLNPGTYTVAALLPSVADTVGYTTTSGIQLDARLGVGSFPARYQFNTPVLEYPTSTASASASFYVGPNFLITSSSSVPEPGAVAQFLAGASLCGLGVLGSRRRRPDRRISR